MARIRIAEEKLTEIALEYESKRKAGLVPTKPIPARTLLWQEVSTGSTRSGYRGACIFNRNGVDRCFCTKYHATQKGQNCEECSHGACWHKQVNRIQDHHQPEREPSVWNTMEAIKLMDANDYYSSGSYDSEDDESDIANEMAAMQRPKFPSTGFEYRSGPTQLQAALASMLHDNFMSDDDIENHIQEHLKKPSHS